MNPLLVAIFGTDENQCAILKAQVDGTSMAKAVMACANLPENSRDPWLRRIEEAGASVVLVDIASDYPSAAIRAMELIHKNLPEVAVLAIGDASKPQTILGVMRASAREFLERPVSIDSLLAAFALLTAKSVKSQEVKHLGKIFTFINAKGGSGATTVAVNAAVSLQRLSGSVAIVDLAPIGQVALHFNQKPSFTVLDALQSIDQLDRSLLEAYMTRSAGGVHILAGADEPALEAGSTAGYARLLEFLIANYAGVIVDASSRLDAVTRAVCDLSELTFIVAQADVASLWSASKVQRFIGQGSGRSQMAVLLNRFRKISGFGDSDIERTVHAPVIWKIPDHHDAVSVEINRGIPVCEQRASEIAKSFAGLASLMRDTGHSDNLEPSTPTLEIRSNG